MTMQYELTEEGKQVINELVKKYYKCFGEVNPSKSVEHIFEEKYGMEEDIGCAAMGFGFLYSKERADEIKRKVTDPKNLSELEKQIYGFFDGVRNKSIRNVLFAGDEIYMQMYKLWVNSR
jgi:hypothetical protein